MTPAEFVVTCARMNWPVRLNAIKLKRENERLAFALIRAKEQLQISQRLQTGMKIALALRANKISALSAQIDQLRTRNRQLDLEAEMLAAMVNLAPAPDAVTAAAE